MATLVCVWFLELKLLRKTVKGLCPLKFIRSRRLVKRKTQVCWTLYLFPIDNRSRNVKTFNLDFFRSAPFACRSVQMAADWAALGGFELPGTWSSEVVWVLYRRWSNLWI